MKYSLQLFKRGENQTKTPKGLIYNTKGDKTAATPRTLKKWAADYAKTQNIYKTIKWWKVNPGIKGYASYWISSIHDGKDGVPIQFEIHQDGYGK